MMPDGYFSYVEGEDVDRDHPHGDLDRIVLTGITSPYKLYGEPIAWMMNMVSVLTANGAIPFALIWNGDSYSNYSFDVETGVFSRKFKSSKIIWLKGSIKLLYTNYTHVFAFSFEKTVRATSGGFLSDHNAQAHSLQECESYSLPDPVSGSELDQSLISTLNSDIKRIPHVLCNPTSGPGFRYYYVNRQDIPYQCVCTVSGIDDYYLDFYYGANSFGLGYHIYTYRDFKEEEKLKPEDWHPIYRKAKFFVRPPRGIDCIKIKCPKEINWVYAYLRMTIDVNDSRSGIHNGAVWISIRMTKSVDGYFVISSDSIYSTLDDFKNLISIAGLPGPPSYSESENWSWVANASLPELVCISSITDRP